MWKCKRNNCWQERIYGEHRRHGYCCNACKHGEANHTHNCSGYMWKCKRHKCRQERIDGEHRPHGYCCNACKHGEANHTYNCSGYGPAVPTMATSPVVGDIASGYRQHHQRLATAIAVEPVAWHVPDAWKRKDSGVLDFIAWYLNKYEIPFAPLCRIAWQQLERALASIPVDQSRELKLEALKESCIPERFCLGGNYVNVHAGGVDGHCSRLYSMHSVTGVDFRVQAYVASQAITVYMLLLAIRDIETHDLHSFAFVCHGATHRSVACCFLLAATVYSNSCVVLNTTRTMDAALKRGLYVSVEQRIQDAARIACKVV
jgi:hypothetical protein